MQAEISALIGRDFPFYRVQLIIREHFTANNSPLALTEIIQWSYHAGASGRQNDIRLAAVYKQRAWINPEGKKNDDREEN